MTLRTATADDFAFIRSLAQRPENAPFITDEDEAALARYLDDPTCRLLIWGDHAGFALFCEIGEASGRVELRRLALATTGKGLGRAFVMALVDYGFRDLAAQKIWLDASSENPRAQRLYQNCGFTLEGRLRDHWYRPALKRNVDLMLYGLLRAEWQSTLAAPAPQA